MNYNLSTIFVFQIFFLICCLSGLQEVHCQEYILRGVVKDSSGEVLHNTNILAFPELIGEKATFAISNNQGEFKLSLINNLYYQIEVSYLGYQKQLLRLKINKDTIKNFILKPSVAALDEVILNYKIPIIVKEDTIIYNPNAFVNGQERKLREVLKKLPGVEVDREGNVKVNGKKVTKVMVDDKVFFTGDSKLAVNNIPANAIAQIEILDNYSEVGFLKGLEDSDKMAMNVRLKEDKKKFTFGDIEAGVGIQDRYIIHPTIFYYSPKTNINFISDLNNTGMKSFTLNDYIDFEGGFGKLMADSNGFSNLYNDDFSKYLAQSDFKENTSQFSAFNLRQSVSTKTDVNAYVIANRSDTETEINTLNEYIKNTTSFIEKRNTNEMLKNFFVIGKSTLHHRPSKNADLSVNSFIKISRNNLQGSILTVNPVQDNTFGVNGELDALNLKQNLEYSKRFSKTQTVSFETTLNYGKNRSSNNWISNVPFLSGLIPLQDDTLFNVFQQTEIQSSRFDVIMKDYWVLNNYNHIYTTIGTNLLYEDYLSFEEQRLSDGSVNNFSSEGFGNELSYRFNDIFFGLEYKFLTGIFTTKAGLVFHNYRWQNNQSELKTTRTTQLLLPQWSTEVEFNKNEKLNFKYNVKANFPNTPKLIGNFLLNDFNEVFIGDRQLANEKYHSLSLNYYKFSLFRGLNINAGLFYNRKTQSIKSNTVLEGIEQLRTLAMFQFPENSITANFVFGKKIKDVKYTLEADAGYHEFFQIVNNTTSLNISKTANTTAKVETYFEKFPNLEMGYTYSPSIFVTGSSSLNFTTKEFFFNLHYDFLDDFQVKMDYSKFNYINESANNTDVFDIANGSLFYQKEDSPWGFEIQTTNILNTQFKRSNSFSDFLISDQAAFILPRIILVKMTYKF